MKNILKLIVFAIINSCNTSDNYEKLPFGGYEIQYEGGSLNRMMQNNIMIIDSGLVDCKYNDYYMFISVDTTYSDYPEKVKKRDLKYFMHDVKNDTSIKRISYDDLQKMIKKKSLEDIDVTK